MPFVWRRSATCLLLVVVVGAIKPVRAQEPEGEDAPQAASAEGPAEDSAEEGGGSLIPLPVIFYQPRRALDSA